MQFYWPMEESPTSSTTSLLAADDCSKCGTLQKEVEALRRQEAFFLTLKTKLIKTDALVKKYMSKCQEAEEHKNNLKALECENADLTQKCKIWEEELKKTMKETLPWKLSKDMFLEEMENVKSQLEDTQLKLSASESLCCQYEQKIESSDMQEADHISTIQSLKEELRQAELRYKTESQKLMKAKEEALMLRRKLSKQKAKRQKYQSDNEKTNDNDEDVIEDMSDEDDSDDDGDGDDDKNAVRDAKSGENTSQQQHDAGSSMQRISDSAEPVHDKLNKSTESHSEEDSELSEDEEVVKCGRSSSGQKKDSQNQDSRDISQSVVEDREDVHHEEKYCQSSKVESSDSDDDFEEMQASLFDEDDVNAIEQGLGTGAEDTNARDRLDSWTDANLQTGHRVSEEIMDTDSEVEDAVCGQHKMEEKHTLEGIQNIEHDLKGELEEKKESNNNDESLTKEKKIKNMEEEGKTETLEVGSKTVCIQENITKNQRMQENAVQKKEDSEKIQSTNSNQESGLEEDDTKDHEGSDEKGEESYKMEEVDKTKADEDDEMEISTAKPKETCPSKADELPMDEDDEIEISTAVQKENCVSDSKGRDVTSGEDVKMIVSTEEPGIDVNNDSKEEGISTGGDGEMHVIAAEPQEDVLSDSKVCSISLGEDVEMEVGKAEPRGGVANESEVGSVSLGEDVELEVGRTEPQGGVGKDSEGGSVSVRDNAEMGVIAAETEEDSLNGCNEGNVSVGKDAGIILNKDGKPSAQDMEIGDGQHAMTSTHAMQIDGVDGKTLSHLNTKEDDKTYSKEQDEGSQSLPGDEEKSTAVDEYRNRSGQRSKECPSDKEKRKDEGCLRDTSDEETAGGSDISRCKGSNEMETPQCETVEARTTEECSKDEEGENPKVTKEGLTSEELGEKDEAEKCKTMRNLLMVQSEVTCKTNEPVLGEGSTNSEISHAEDESLTRCDARTANQCNNEVPTIDECNPSIDGSNLKERSDSSKDDKVHQRSNLQKLTISCPSEGEQQSEKVEVGSAGFDSSELNEIIGTERTGREVHTKMSMGVKTEFTMSKIEMLPCIPEKQGSPSRRTEKTSLEPMITSFLESLPLITRVLSPIPMSPGRGDVNEEDDDDKDDELSLHQRTLSPLSPPDASCFLPPFSSSERTLSPLPGTPVPPDDSLEGREDDEGPSDSAMPTNFHASAPKGTVAVRPRARSLQTGGGKDDSDRGTKRKIDAVEESVGEQSKEQSDETSGIKSKKNKKKGLSVASNLDDGQSSKKVTESVIDETEEQSGRTVDSLTEENLRKQNKVEKVGEEVEEVGDSLSISRKTEPMDTTDQKDDIIKQCDSDGRVLIEEGFNQTSNVDSVSENKERSFVELCCNDAQPQGNQPMDVDAASEIEGILSVDSQGTDRKLLKQRKVIPTSESSDLIEEREGLEKTSTINRENPQTNQKIVLSELLENIRTQKTELLSGLVKKVIVFLDQNPVDLLSVQLSKSVVGNKSTRPVVTYPEEELLGVMHQRKVRFTEEVLHCLGTLIVLPRMKDDEKLAHTKRLTFLRMYSALCRVKGLSMKLRILCFDIVIRRVQHWEELLLCVASVWPHILTRQKGRIAQPIINAMELVVWKSLKSKKNTNTNQTEALWQALKFTCDWKDPTIQSEETMVTNFLQSLSEANKKNLMNKSNTSPISNSSYETAKAIEMLAWSKGWKWTWSFIVVESVWPILAGQCKVVSKDSEWDHGLVCACLKVLGIIGQVERKPHRELFELIERISDFTKYNACRSTGVPAIIQAHAVGAILSLSTSCPCFAAQMLKNWSEDPNPQLVKGDKVRLEVLMETCKGLVDLNAAPEKSREASRPEQTKRWGQSNEMSKKCSRGRKKFRR